MQDQNLRVTRTHSADEFEGSLFGIDVIHFKWIALTLLVGLAIFAGLFYGRGFGFLEAGKWALLPLAACFLYLRFGHQGKPPGHIADLLDSLLTQGHARPPYRIQKPPRDNERHHS